MVGSLLRSLIITIVIELITSIGLGIRKKEDIKVIILTNIITNPVVVYLTLCIMLFNNEWLYYTLIIIMEIMVVIIEAKIYKKHLTFKEKSPVLISTVNNAASFFTGVIKSIILSWLI